MDPRLREIVDNLAEDGTSGASEMQASILNSLLAISDEDLATTASSEWEDFAIALYRAKPTIAPVFNIANTILLKLEQGGRDHRDLHDGLMEIVERERRSGARIADMAVRTVKGRWFMTTSFSATVAHVFKALAKERKIKVTVAESTPGGEGRQFAKLLAEQGIETEIIYDSTVFARMEHINAAIVGADSVTSGGLVNKVGTRAVAEAARAYDRETYAVCGWSKLCPVVLTNLAVKTETLGKRMTEHVQLFESSPLELFSHIITDQGYLSSADLRMELKVRKVARVWYSRGVIQR